VGALRMAMRGARTNVHFLLEAIVILPGHLLPTALELA
jgi:hypothetical protein